MKRIGLLTDREGRSVVRDALDMIVQKRVDYQLETIKDFVNIDSVANAVWGMLNLIDVLVVQVTKNSPNLFYEIGLAHGLGKPVVMVLDEAVSLPPDLAGQRVIAINSDNYTVESLAFSLTEAFHTIFSSQRRVLHGYDGPRTPASQVSQADIRSNFKSLFVFDALQRGQSFERWFFDMAREVSGWEVIRTESRPGLDNGFDLVVWNSRDDSELAALGNPIGIELRAVSAMNSEQLRGFLNRTRTSGLKTVILATTGRNNERLKQNLRQVSKDEGINAIALDRDDLSQVSYPQDLVKLLKQKVRELLYDRKF